MLIPARGSQREKTLTLTISHTSAQHDVRLALVHDIFAPLIYLVPEHVHLFSFLSLQHMSANVPGLLVMWKFIL